MSSRSQSTFALFYDSTHDKSLEALQIVQAFNEHNTAGILIAVGEVSDVKAGMQQSGNTISSHLKVVPVLLDASSGGTLLLFEGIVNIAARLRDLTLGTPNVAPAPTRRGGGSENVYDPTTAAPQPSSGANGAVGVTRGTTSGPVVPCDVEELEPLEPEHGAGVTSRV